MLSGYAAKLGTQYVGKALRKGLEHTFHPFELERYWAKVMLMAHEKGPQLFSP